MKPNRDTTYVENSAVIKVDVQRRERLVQDLFTRIEEQHLAALLITDPTNIRWLTGFTGSSSYVVFTYDSEPQIELITDRRYEGRVEQELNNAGSNAKVRIAKRYRDALSESLTPPTSATRATLDKHRIGVEAHHMTLALAKTLEDDWLENVEVVPCVESISELRSVKDDAEIQRMTTAAQVAQSALSVTLEDMFRPGVTEIEFAQYLKTQITNTVTVWGQTSLAFDIIVASGPNGAIAHHEPTQRQFQDQDLVIIDLGAKVDGYCSDMTRTFTVGEQTQRQKEICDLVQRAQETGIGALTHRQRYDQVDSDVRTVIEDGGYGQYFTHGTGHGLGLEIHENPSIGSESQDEVQLGQTVTVEPGIYIAGYGGVRIEDSCQIADDKVRYLTDFTKTL